jgi:hypothetical protein
LATGIAELIEDKNMIVYPNPTSGMIKIISNASKEAVYEIFDILGNVILKQQDLHEADLSSYAKGMYFIRITDNGDSYTKRIVVK